MYFIVIVIIIIIACIYKHSMDTKEKEQKATQQRQQVQQQEEFEQFCERHPELKGLVAKSRYELNACARNAAAGMSVYIKPTPPQYTRGVFKGSLADNISVVANAQKKADYEKQLEDYENGLKSNMKFKSEAQIHADAYFDAQVKLIDELVKIPGAEKYVEKEIESMEKVKALLRK